MSWDPRFEVTLVNPSDHPEVVRTARLLAKACHLRRCRMTTADAVFVATVVAARPMPLGVTVEALDFLTVPPVLQQGRATSVVLRVCFEAPRPPVTIAMLRDACGALTTTFTVDGARRDVVEPCVRECAELAHGIGTLTSTPDTILERLDLAAPKIAIPVRADAFPALLREVERAMGGAYFELEAEVAAAHGPELVATAPAGSSYSLHVEVEDELVLDAVRGARADDLVVEWDDPDDEIWIPAVYPSGGIVDDGRVYAVTLAMGTTPRLVVEAIIDHCGVDNAAAWLAERARAPVAYLASPER